MRRTTVSATLLLTLVLGFAAGSVATNARADAAIDGFIDVAPEYHVPAGNAGTSIWRYRTSTPPSSWYLPDHDDSAWPQGQAGFGQYPVSGDHIGTLWTTGVIYLRRWVELDADQIADLAFHGRWDDAIEVYVNGVLAFDLTSWSSEYRYFGLSTAARATLQPGANLIAVRCQDYGGGRYVDLGLCSNPLRDLPVSGASSTPAVAGFADSVERFMRDNVIPAGALAVMKGDQVVALHGFGYRERDLQTPVPADAVLRLASNDKVVTRGIVQHLIDAGAIDPVTGTTITPTTVVFPILQAHGITTPGGGPFTDAWINEITIAHLLEHRSGVHELPWVHDLASAWSIGVDDLHSRHNAGWIGSQHPQFRPGYGSAYSSAGYFLLRYLVELVTGDVEAYLQDVVLASASTTDIHVSRERANDRLDREPWYATNEDSYPRWAYLDEYFALGASAEGMVRYLRRYHLSLGTPLEDPVTGEWAAVPDNGLGVFYGAMAGTWSVTVQRRWDEVNIALVFNQVDVYDAITDELLAIADGIPAGAWGAGVVAVGEDQAPAVASRLDVFPNPASGHASVSFAPTRTGAVELEIIDVRGRRVRLYAMDGRRGTPVTVAWDGHDEAGRPLPDGVYFAIVHGDGEVRRSKIVLVR